MKRNILPLVTMCENATNNGFDGAEIHTHLLQAGHHQATDVEVDVFLELRAKAEPPRGHLGMSQIGHPDPRTTWLNWRWCLPEDPRARMERIFDIGRWFENYYVELMRSAGYTVYDEQNGKQIGFSFHGDHFAGSCDGVAIDLPESKGKPALLEFKALKCSSWNQLNKHKLFEYSKTYWFQVQSYLHCLKSSGVEVCVFIALNKDTGEIYRERIEYIEFTFEKLSSLALDLLEAVEPPESSYPHADYYELKNYKNEEYQKIYWGEQLPNKPHCRNCRHGKPLLNMPGATWICQRTGEDLSVKQQFQGCFAHNWLACFMSNLKIIEVDNINNKVIYSTSNGNRIVNVSANDKNEVNDFTSKELIALSKTGFTLQDDDNINKLRSLFNAELTAVLPPEDLT